MVLLEIAAGIGLLLALLSNGDNRNRSIQPSLTKYEYKTRMLEESNFYISRLKTQILNDKNFCLENISLFYSSKDPSFRSSLSSILNGSEIQRKIKYNFTSEFLETAKNMSQLSIKHLNIMAIGNSGVGKSLLINTVLGLENQKSKAKSEMIKPTTKELNEYISKKRPQLRIVDTRGIEKENYNIKKMLIDIQKYIEEKENQGDPDKFVHCIWYCLTGNRIEDIEEQTMKELASLYNNSTLPIIVVYTQATLPEYYQNFEKYVKKNFPFFSFVPVLAKTFKTKSGSQEEPFGIDELIKLSTEKAKNAIYSSVFTSLSNKVKEFTKEKINQYFENIVKKDDLTEEKKLSQVFENILGIKDNKLVKELSQLIDSIYLWGKTEEEPIWKKCVNIYLEEKNNELTEILERFNSRIENHYETYFSGKNEMFEEVRNEFKRDLLNFIEKKMDEKENEISKNKVKEVFGSINDIVKKSFNEKNNSPVLNEKITKIIQSYFTKFEKNISSFN